MQVLFAKIHGDQHIREVEKLSILIKQELECAGFKGDSKSFKPHMTIAKMSKAKKLYKKVRNIPSISTSIQTITISANFFAESTIIPD